MTFRTNVLGAALVGWLAAVVAPGCNRATPAVGAPCALDGGCGAGLVCGAEKVCVEADGGAGHDAGPDGGEVSGGGADGGPDAGPDAGRSEAPDGGLDAGPDAGPDAGAGPSCFATGDGCDPSGSTPCCSGVCETLDGGGFACAAPSFCLPSGVACQKPTDCCSNACVSGQCASGGCVTVGAGCAAAAACCSDVCTNGLCVALASSCTTLGNSCTAGSQCCSTNCQGGICVRDYVCNADGDICFTGHDCCSGLCDGVDGGPGTCQSASAPGTGACVVDGEPCNGGATVCCSRLCVDPGSGVYVCAPASGCRLTGDLCTQSSDCCGGANASNQVTCSLVSQDPPIGYCTNPNGAAGGTGCEPVGDICGAGGANARQDCCDGQKAVCKQDSEGIWRCFGGGGAGGCSPTGYSATDPSCCIAAGQACEFRDQCCNQTPCLPGPDGGYVCTPAPSCLAAGSLCAGDAGCCTGLLCAPAGPLGDACQYPVPVPDGGAAGDGGTAGGDGGAGDGGASAADAGPSCLADQSTCSAGSQCCSGYCSAGVCSVPPSCEPQSGSCTSTADCCLGLTCSIAEITGTCQPTTTACAQVGQVCALSSDCCTGLSCLDLAGATCATGESCTCETQFL